MKKSLITFAVILFISVSSFAQTKLIAHRSHSGSNATFSAAGLDNFGLPPGKVEKDSSKNKVDSVKKIIPVTRKKKSLKHKTVSPQTAKN